MSHTVINTEDFSYCGSTPCLALSELKLLTAFQARNIQLVPGITINLVVKVEKPSTLHLVPCKSRDIKRSPDHSLISHLYEEEEENIW